MPNEVGGKRAGGQPRRQNTWPSVSVKKDTLAVEAKVTWLQPARMAAGNKVHTSMPPDGRHGACTGRCRQFTNYQK